jgi:hypothetical protein
LLNATAAGLRVSFSGGVPGGCGFGPRPVAAVTAMIRLAIYSVCQVHALSNCLLVIVYFLEMDDAEVTFVGAKCR